MRSTISDLFSLVGAISMIVAAFLINPIIGLIAVGLFAFVFSYFLRE